MKTLQTCSRGIGLIQKKPPTPHVINVGTSASAGTEITIFAEDGQTTGTFLKKINNKSPGGENKIDNESPAGVNITKTFQCGGDNGNNP